MSTLSPQQAVQVLVKAKWSEARIAKAVGTSQPTIHRLKRGTQKSVAFEVGTKLVAIATPLWSDVGIEAGAA
ncbi:hypothetical protein [Stenotrophomonas maltophilia]|uniref:Uncharacterized protein n=1 Tax=Stenotrophomonas maltophilia TaxID=40324 RepID=A0AAJ2J9N7_STEMA|nr:hypothetical protein [Stenotrophomonas maltophilia]MDT3467913.1 hypothetical protein [Stenotrophomonas maltophilia]